MGSESKPINQLKFEVIQEFPFSPSALEEMATRLEAAEAERDAYRNALEKIALERKWPNVVMIDLVQVARDALAANDET